MERVQYQLERSIPQLQLLDEHAVFTKEQLRSITTQRQTFEGRLLRRGPEKADFLRYADFERNLADLINVKANRIGLPRSFHRDNAAAHTGHIVAIYERMVLKFKYDVDAWQKYIAFAKSRKMRVVTGRVYARALALHPNNVPLWLAAAAHELNDNASTTAARSLLQRALRLNRLPWKHSDYSAPASALSSKRAASDPSSDSSKRKRVDSSSTSNGIDGASTVADSGPAALKVSDREADLLRLWVEYIRMELVFIERLRRRWLVLGLEWESQDSSDDLNASSSNDSSEAQQAALDLDHDTTAAEPANSDELDQDQERILLSQVPEKDADAPDQESDATTGAKPNTFTPRKMTTIPPAQIGILRGSIPLFLVGSALEALAPHLHFVFLVALVDVLQTFPFVEPLSLDAPKSGQALRKQLLDRVYQHLSDRQRWGWHHFAPAALVSALRSFRPEAVSHADEAERTAAHVANTEEMESHRLLTSASHLRTTFANETDGLLDLAAQLRAGTKASRRTTIGSSSVLAVELVLQLLQSLLTVMGGSGTRASASYQALASSGVLPIAVSDAIAKMRQWCVEAPMDVMRKGRSAKSELYTTTALLIEMLGDAQRSAIDEPNLLQYLESVQTQLVAEARAAGPNVETAQMRAVSLRSKVDAALAIDAEKERSKKLAKLQAQLKDATRAFAASDELWSLRILVASQLAKTSGESLEQSRDSIGAEWRRGLQACAGAAQAATATAESSLWCRYFEWLDHGVVGSSEATRKEKKVAFRYSSEQYRWAVRETASLLSRSSSDSAGNVEAMQQFRQDVHDLCVSRYLGLSGQVGQLDETLSWLLQSSFASHEAWLNVVSDLVAEQDKDKQVRKIFAKLLQVKPNEVEVWTAYLRYLAAGDMTKALQALDTCRSTVHAAEYKLVEREWHTICQDLEKATQATLSDSDVSDEE